jgi:hypothetical protein
MRAMSSWTSPRRTKPFSLGNQSMAQRIDLIGQRFGKLLVKSWAGNDAWHCVCDCGRTSVVFGLNLRHGRSRSCGCNIGRNLLKHGQSYTATYAVWQQMVARCTNPKHASWDDYGGRGITVCERWRDYANFHADMGDAPKGLSIERMDNNGGYEPDNCKWATPLEQRHNSRPRRKR